MSFPDRLNSTAAGCRWAINVIINYTMTYTEHACLYLSASSIERRVFSRYSTLVEYRPSEKGRSVRMPPHTP